jgi:hypothetical protein
MAINFYDIGAALLRHEPARFATLQSVLEQVNAKLTRAGDSYFVLPPTEESSRKRRRVRFGRGVRGMTDQAADAERADQNSGLTHADALALFSVAHAQSRAAEPVSMGRDFALAGRPADLPAAQPPLLRPNNQGDGVAGRISGAEVLRLVAQASPEVDDHTLPAASILPQDALPQMRGIAENVSNRGPLSRFVPTVRNEPGEGAQIRVKDSARHGRNAGAMIDDVWRRIKTPTKAESGDAAAYGADDGGARLVGAIVTATLAAQQVQLSGRVPEPAPGSRIPGATPDAPVYTRMVPDHPAVPVQVTNADALTSATVHTLATHQSAMPTGPTGLNNNLVPPAPGIPAPGSYQP